MGLALSHAAHAQLREPEVLVVYDSRISDSLLVAEAYAGSVKVPGGVGNTPGTRPGVRVVNLATLPGAGVFPATPDISHATFSSALRTPLRNYLTSNNLTYQIRCFVLTKGLPHRITDFTRPTIGDDPATLNTAFADGSFGDFTYASVDSELTLLWQTLIAGEDSANADSKSDGMIASPFALKGLPASAFSNRFITTAPKTLVAVPLNGGSSVQNGFVWQTTVGLTASDLTAGDLYLVCRLDAPSVQNVRDMLTRAQNLVINTSSAGIVLDTDGRPFDSVAGLGTPFDTGGPDYTNARDALLADGRFPSANISFDSFAGFPNFIVGPNIAFSGTSYIIPRPLVYLGHFGSNHFGVTVPANTTYAQSFNFAPGAVFNTMESFNGRDFGGRGQLPAVPQQQASAFLAAGGTFAVANVWEPFTLSVPRTRELVQRFLLSNLTWAEAAYSALPVLSWQQIVLGDPLARVTRTSEDTSADGRLTIDDLYRWHDAPTDVNRSGTADSADADIILAGVRGYEAAAMKGSQR